MRRTVLDAAALLALPQQEAGANVVAQAVQHGTVICAVNLAEVVGKLADEGVPANVLEQILDPLDIEVVPFDTRLANRGAPPPGDPPERAGAGRSRVHRPRTGAGLPRVGADRSWQDLPHGVELYMIR
ncbi:MAG: hypothetical protein QJR03_10430 [Sphaerobacter sp.]|nr:hypothetical protein [Sphaerobacter sp.]